MRITTGSSDTRPFSRLFQVRWAERLGDPENPYLVRWTLILFGFSIRLHHWLRSDDRRFFHDHAADFLSIVLFGYYSNVVPMDPDLPPSRGNQARRLAVGMFNSFYSLRHWRRAVWFSRAEDRHFLDIPEGGAWTLLLEGRKRRNWGFFVPRMDRRHRYVGPARLMRPYMYFKKYGIIQENPFYQ